MKKVLFPALCSIFLMNCNESPLTSASRETPKTEPMAAAVVAVTDRIFTDGSGDVQTLVRTCDYPSVATAGNNCSYCAVDAGWVMVGGGGEIEGSPAFARLRGSYPTTFLSDVSSTCNGNTPNNDPNLRHMTWVAKSGGNTAHRLRAYVIGMKVNGLTESELTTLRAINQNATTVNATQPSIETSGFGLSIGGGVSELGGNNCYLTESRPNEAAGTWRGSLYCPTPGRISVNHITLNACPTVPGWENCFQQKIRSAVSGPVTAGYGTASVTTPYPWVTTGLGGKGVVNSASSRFLADLLPLVGTNQGASVTTKDHMASVTGATTAYAINLIGGRWGTWRYNSVRFNSGGSTLHRPSGAAPVALRQAFVSPDATPYRWYLEPVGSGQYRLRNANPSRPASGECAYRQPGTSNVLVGPCNTTNEYKWTAPEGILSSNNTHKLRNVASGTCLDNNNSTVASNLLLVACITGYSPRQSFFKDTYSWLP